ncbi:MAG: hypothetical protein V4544_01025 [Pseudomonadota bacterium]
MKSILIFTGLLGVLILSSQNTFAANIKDKVEVNLLNKIAERFKLAAKAFDGHVDNEIKIINQDSSNLSDDPNNIPPNSFMHEETGAGGGMTCYYADTLSIAASSDPKYKIGDKFDPKLANDISKEMKDNVAEAKWEKLVTDENNGSTKNEEFITVAWQGKKLTGTDKSKLVCTVTAPIPAA